MASWRNHVHALALLIATDLLTAVSANSAQQNLIDASVAGNLAWVKALLAANGNVNARDAKGGTPLMGELRKEAPEKAKWGIERGLLRSASLITPVAWDGGLETESSSGSHNFSGGLVEPSHKTDLTQVSFVGSGSENALGMFRKVFSNVLLADTSTPATAVASENQRLYGAICDVDKATHTIKFVPWDKEKHVWDVHKVRAFKLMPETTIHGETRATVAELDSGTAIVKSFHLTGLSIDGGTQHVSGTPFEIKDISQLLHRRARMSWTGGAQIPEATTVGLPYLLDGESMGGMMILGGGTTGFQTIIRSDDVTVKCGNK